MPTEGDDLINNHSNAGDRDKTTVDNASRSYDINQSDGRNSATMAKATMPTNLGLLEADEMPRIEEMAGEDEVDELMSQRDFRQSEAGR